MMATVEVTDLVTQTRTTADKYCASKYPPPSERDTIALWTFPNKNQFICTQSSVTPVTVTDEVKYCPTCKAPHCNKSKKCWTCKMWDDVDTPRHFFIDGNAYYVGPEDDQSWCSKGSNGHKFRIGFIDRSRPDIITTNLWCRGKVPPSHRGRFPTNAFFEAR